MDLREYQQRALETDQVPARGEDRVIVPLLGLAGEAGELLSEYKKYLRDGDAHRLFKDRVAEELGDLLWYLANVASKFGLDLDEVAEANLVKARDRWLLRGRPAIEPDAVHLFDARFPEHERLPRRFEARLSESREGDTIKVRLFIDGRQVGDPLTDNAYAPDDYRLHDVFHLAHAAVLGWSPVLRSLLKRKRKSRPEVDEVEDGARAIAIEEGLSAIIFDYAQRRTFLEGITALDSGLLRTIKDVTSHLEVSRCTYGDWEAAVLQGFAVWREIVKHRGGRVDVNLDGRSLAFLGPCTAHDE